MTSVDIFPVLRNLRLTVWQADNLLTLIKVLHTSQHDFSCLYSRKLMDLDRSCYVGVETRSICSGWSQQSNLQTKQWRAYLVFVLLTLALKGRHLREHTQANWAS